MICFSSTYIAFSEEFKLSHLTLCLKKVVISKKEHMNKILGGIDTRLGLLSDSSQSPKVEREYRWHKAKGSSQHWALAKGFLSDTFIYSCTLDCANNTLETSKVHF